VLPCLLPAQQLSSAVNFMVTRTTLHLIYQKVVHPVSTGLYYGAFILSLILAISCGECQWWVFIARKTRA
jgi:hypothetical protein